MSEELKPCPFCGAHNRGDILDIYPASPSLGQNKWRVVCDDCGAEGPTVPAHNADNPDELCERAWNTRADDAELVRLRAENERLRGEISACGKNRYRLQIDNTALCEALRFYANPEIYKPHPHGPAFDDRDLSFKAKAALENIPTLGEQP